jgi:hypothetical protein
MDETLFAAVPTMVMTATKIVLGTVVVRLAVTLAPPPEAAVTAEVCSVMGRAP